MNLENNKIYNVVHRTWDNTKHVRANREYLMRELRFGSIPCYVFSSRLTAMGYTSVISIPEYDIVKIDKPTGQWRETTMAGTP